MSYDLRVDPEFPGDGDWRRPTYAFDADGKLLASGHPWGAPLIIEVVLPDSSSWSGSFRMAGSMACGKS